MITEIFNKIAEIVSSINNLRKSIFLIAVIKGGTFVTPYKIENKEAMCIFLSVLVEIRCF